MLPYSQESQVRLEKIQKLRSAGVIVYANKFNRTHNTLDLRSQPVLDADALMQTGAQDNFFTAGRVVLYRSHGKLAFGKIKDAVGEVQLCFVRDLIKVNTGKEVISSISIDGEDVSAHKFVEKFVDVGDYIGVSGDLFVTKHGELTLFVNTVQLLSKAVRPLPEKFHGVSDKETLYRQRYLDLITNDETYDRFLLRSKFIKTLRDFYDENGFLELETPILGNAASGAAAKPFITHHNDYDLDVYLRISPETALKKATVGRFEKVFEIARDFRNEGTDPSHLQEFTMVEHYAVYWNFQDNMRFTEDMINYLFDKLNLDRKVMIKDKNGVAREVDFTTPWERIDYVERIKKDSGIDVSQYGPADSDKLLAQIKANGIEFEGMDNMVTATLIDYLYKKVTRPKIVGPAFIYNYPKTMQPLARVSDENPNVVEQFQVVVNGWEIVKAYSELVDPIEQKANFDAQGEALEKGDEEATSGDDDFVLAMEYGMPCQSGLGFGIDRFLTLILGQENIRDVVLFPLMKPVDGIESGEGKIENNKRKDTKIAVAIINKASGMELWQEFNTVGHLSSAFAARVGRSLFMQDTIKTADNNDIKLNIQHAIMIKQSDNQKKIIDVMSKAKELGLEVSEFTREMLITTDDRKVVEMTVNKRFDDVEYLGVLIFGNKKQVDELTKEFELYS